MNVENRPFSSQPVLCPKCHTPHKRIDLKEGQRARCSACDTVMYQKSAAFLDRAIVWSLTGLIFFVLANFFPIVKIKVLGHEQYITIVKTFESLIEYEFYVVGAMTFFLIFFFPLMVIGLYLIVSFLLKVKKGKEAVAGLLVALSRIQKWNMIDIFFISILVALVKLIGYAQIEIGIAFWSLLIFVAIDLYLTRSIKTSWLWECFAQRFGADGV